MSSDPNAMSGLEVVNPEEEARRRREQILSLFRGRLHWVVMLALLLGTVAGLAGYFSQKEVYQGEAAVRINPDVITMLKTQEMRVPRDFAGYIREQMGAMKSDAVIERAMGSDEWGRALGETGEEQLSASDFRDAIEADTPPKTNNLIVVSFTHANPDLAAAGANAVVQAYLETFRQDIAEKIDDTIASYKNEITQLGYKRDQLVQQINARLETDESIYRARLDAENKKLIDVEQQLRETTILLNYYNPSESGNVKFDEFQDPGVLEFEEKIGEVQSQIDLMLSMNYGENHKDVRQLRAQASQLRSKRDHYIQQRRGGNFSGGGTELAGLRAAEKQLREQKEELSRSVAEMDKQITSIAGFKSELEETQSYIDGFKDQEYRAKLAGDQLKKRVEPAGWSATPEEPSNAKKRLKLAALGFVGGGCMGVGLVVLIGLLDSRLRHASDARTGLRDVRMLGVLPSLPDTLDDPDQAERAAHAVNHIRTLLQISEPGHRVFSITGPAAGSGKSSLSVAMGLSFAASGNKVLLIDGDIVGAGLTRRLGAVVTKPFEEVLRADGRVSAQQIDDAEHLAIRKGINLMDALIEQGVLSRDEAERLARRRSDASLGLLDVCNGTPLSECVAETGIPRLYVLPVGAARPEDAGLLSPQSFDELLRKARTAYDIVLIDTGPVLGSLEASMAGAAADGTILIVSRGDSKSIATRSLEHLHGVGAQVAGIVFNHALESDLAESSYGSMVSQDRRLNETVHVDPAAAARFGPLGSAVATFGPAAALRHETSRRSPAHPVPPTTPAEPVASHNGDR